jgi:hypothetical protein
MTFNVVKEIIQRIFIEILIKFTLSKNTTTWVLNESTQKQFELLYVSQELNKSENRTEYYSIINGKYSFLI